MGLDGKKNKGKDVEAIKHIDRSSHVKKNHQEGTVGKEHSPATLFFPVRHSPTALHCSPDTHLHTGRDACSQHDFQSISTDTSQMKKKELSFHYYFMGAAWEHFS